MRPTCSLETALDQATMTSKQYLHGAKTAIDDVFHDGYAAKHPELVAAFIQCSCKDFNNVTILMATWAAIDQLESLASAHRDLSDAISSLKHL